MKLLIASDIHGSLKYCNKLVERYKKEGCDKLILLGDILYHGPRNDLPDEYNPKGVIALLNGMSDEIFAVRGNCEAEVDDMVLDFNVLADYACLYAKGRLLFLTHGHKYNPQNLPKLKKGDILFNGHTHISKIEELDGILYVNPGSVSIPKENTPRGYIILTDDEIIHKDLDGNILTEYSL
ncbi:MAG: phosphodiesterase [Ruminococcaceae bacterium]|nr:phosphodiesterase [Oscillospiraceae bacterium]